MYTYIQHIQFVMQLRPLIQASCVVRPDLSVFIYSCMPSSATKKSTIVIAITTFPLFIYFVLFNLQNYTIPCYRLGDNKLLSSASNQQSECLCIVNYEYKDEVSVVNLKKSHRSVECQNVETGNPKREAFHELVVLSIWSECKRK